VHVRTLQLLSTYTGLETTDSLTLASTGSKYKSFKLTGLLLFCCLVFTVGFSLREYGAFNYDNVNIYLASTLLIYTSP